MEYVITKLGWTKHNNGSKLYIKGRHQTTYNSIELYDEKMKYVEWTTVIKYELTSFKYVIKTKFLNGRTY